jgi:hypothetical protein
MPPKRKTRLEQLRQAQKQNVIVNVHLAEKAKRRRAVRRGGVGQAKPIMQRPQLQLATPRRMVQQTIHLPPEAIPPQTPFRSQPASHPQYIKTTEHKKKEQELFAKELQRGIDEIVAKKIANYEMSATKPTIKKEVEIKKGQPEPYIPFTPPRKVDVETPRSLNPRRTTVEVNEAVGMGKEDPNPLFARQAQNINVRRLQRSSEGSFKKMGRLDFE